MGALTRRNRKRRKEEEKQIEKDLEQLGIPIRTDPLNALGDEKEVKIEIMEEPEEEEQGITSFTGHSLSGKSKLDAFESKRFL